MKTPNVLPFERLNLEFFDQVSETRFTHNGSRAEIEYVDGFIRVTCPNIMIPRVDYRADAALEVSGIISYLALKDKRGHFKKCTAKISKDDDLWRVDLLEDGVTSTSAGSFFTASWEEALTLSEMWQYSPDSSRFDIRPLATFSDPESLAGLWGYIDSMSGFKRVRILDVDADCNAVTVLTHEYSRVGHEMKLGAIWCPVAFNHLGKVNANA